MDKMMGYCGLICQECPAFLATQADDDKKRAEVAELWSKEYNSDVKPEDINCDGCHSTSGKLLGFSQMCEIRKCSIGKELENCGFCPDYACDKLDMIFKAAPEAKGRLDEVHSRL